ncbi:MAG: ElyC/SanA/YdcF family protein [Deltaproteobacteria bacterium]|nr:ElyC/SanA/YdcF family protein [Deltaproteobacteria bacterium]
MTHSDLETPTSPKSPRSSRSARAKRIAKRALWVVLGFAVVLFGLAMWAENRVRVSAQSRVFSLANARETEVAIVLGARVYANGQPSIILQDRLACGLSLYRRGLVSYVIVSGDHGTDGYDEVRAMREWLLARGVPSEKIYVDHAGFRTLDSMARAAQVFSARRASVCTQAFHLPRSLWLARAFHLDAIGVIADQRSYKSRRVDAVREWLARVRAVLDTSVLHTQPRFVGPGIPLGSDTRATHDRHTVSQ